METGAHIYSTSRAMQISCKPVLLSTRNRAIPHARDDMFGGLVWMVIQPVDSLSVVHYIRPCFGYPRFLRNWFLETDRFLNRSTFFS
jgi:hypothetical protein